MTPIGEFKKKHGADYVKTVSRPDLQAALFIIDTERVNALIALQPDEIRLNGSHHLAEFIGHLKHQNALMTLHERRTFTPTDLPPEDYKDEEPPTASKPASTRRKTR